MINQLSMRVDYLKQQVEEAQEIITIEGILETTKEFYEGVVVALSAELNWLEMLIKYHESF
jgi:hypothetical protein